MTGEPDASPILSAPPTRWTDALLAASMIAIDPCGLGGIHVTARAGEVRDRWLAALATLHGPEAPVRRIAAGVAEARLTGGLDIGLTLEAGRPVVERGVLASADGGLVVVAMAERLTRGAAALLGACLDDGEARIERDGLSLRHAARFALVALDEGIGDDERLEPLLADRLGLRIDLDTVGWREAEIADLPTCDAIGAARQRLATLEVPPAMVEALCAIAETVAGPSLRASLFLLRTARAAAAMRDSATVEREDAATALRLVLGLAAQPPSQQPEQEAEDRETREEADAPPPPPRDASAEEASSPPPPPPPQSPGDAPDPSDDREGPSAQALQEMLVSAVEAVLPKHLLQGLGTPTSQRDSRGASGKAGAVRPKGTRGRAIGLAVKPPVPGARMDVLATLRQAAPWQRVRRRDGAAAPGLGADGSADALAETKVRLLIRKSDFRYLRYRDKTGTTAIFAVDASGSAATQRLAETKGAIELLLAECYVRRDSVALVAFRGREAETLLEPTRSLVRAKRSLSALPGGGGTPLAGGILATLKMAEASARHGQSVVAVFLTDGRGNVALDGTTGRELVIDDLGRAARLFKGCGVRSLLIDTAQRPQSRAQDLAFALGAEYLALPRGGSGALAREVGARMEG